MMKIIKNKGTVLIITFLILGILFLLGSYFLTFTLTETRISKSQKLGLETYYLAEAGINEAIWKLRNDDTTADGDDAWLTDFVDQAKNPDGSGNYWSDSFFRSFASGFYAVTIQNLSPARGEIVSTSTLTLPNGRTAQRVVKTVVFKSLAIPVEDGALFSGGASENIDIRFSKLKIYNGNIFSNHNLQIKTLSTVEVYDNPNTTENLEGKVLAVDNLDLSADSSLFANSDAICAKNRCTSNCEGFPPSDSGCPPNSASLPMVDFDSESPYSFKSRAQNAEFLGQCEVLCNDIPCDNRCIYDETDFEDLLWQVGQGGTLTLNNEITYVTGDIELRGGRFLLINGALVADDNIIIGERYFWIQGGEWHQGLSGLSVNRLTDRMPSGILTKRKINFGLYSSFQNINIIGVIYANDELKITSVPEIFELVGGIIARKLSFYSVRQWLNITLDNDIILYGLGYKIDGEVIAPNYSPVIIIDHWEESY